MIDNENKLDTGLRKSHLTVPRDDTSISMATPAQRRQTKRKVSAKARLLAPDTIELIQNK